MNSAGPRIERSTCVSAAKFTIASTPFAARATASGSAMSPWWNSCSTPSRLARLPAYVSLSRTTTSSPFAVRCRTKCDPMKPAPPVTRMRIGLSVREPSQAFPQPFAPVRQLGCAAFAAEDRVRGTRRLRAELGGRDPSHARRQRRLLEDRLGELGPRAVAGGGHVVRAVRQLEDGFRRLGQVTDVRRAAALVVDDRDLVALGAEPEHRPDEVARGPAEEPRAAHDPGAVAGCRLAVQLRAAVRAERRRRV